MKEFAKLHHELACAESEYTRLQQTRYDPKCVGYFRDQMAKIAENVTLLVYKIQEYSCPDGSGWYVHNGSVYHVLNGVVTCYEAEELYPEKA